MFALIQLIKPKNTQEKKTNDACVKKKKKYQTCRRSAVS